MLFLNLDSARLFYVVPLLYLQTIWLDTDFDILKYIKTILKILCFNVKQRTPQKKNK